MLLGLLGCSKSKSNSSRGGSAAVDTENKKVVEEEGVVGGESSTGNKVGTTKNGAVCEYPKQLNITYPEATYNQTIRIFIDQKCTVCHQGDEDDAPGGLSLVGGFTDSFYQNAGDIVSKVLADHNAGKTNNNTETTYSALIKDAFSKWGDQSYARNAKGQLWIGELCEE